MSPWGLKMFHNLAAVCSQTPIFLFALTPKPCHTLSRLSNLRPQPTVAICWENAFPLHMITDWSSRDLTWPEESWSVEWGPGRSWPFFFGLELAGLSSGGWSVTYEIWELLLATCRRVEVGTKGEGSQHALRDTAGCVWIHSLCVAPCIPPLQTSTTVLPSEGVPKKTVRELDFDFIWYIVVVKILNSWS